MLKDKRKEAEKQEIKSMGLGRLNETMVRWTFKQMLLKSAYSVDEIRSMVAQTPFGKYKIDLDGVGFQIRLEK